MLRVQSVLRQKASEISTALWIIEKDYALSYLLAGISQIPNYYDLWWMLGHAEFNSSIIRTLTTQKCALRNVSFNHPDEFFDDALLEVAYKEWDKLLTPFIPEIISVDKVLEELRAFTGSLWNES